MTARSQEDQKTTPSVEHKAEVLNIEALTTKARERLESKTLFKSEHIARLKGVDVSKVDEIEVKEAKSIPLPSPQWWQILRHDLNQLLKDLLQQLDDLEDNAQQALASVIKDIIFLDEQAEAGYVSNPTGSPMNVKAEIAKGDEIALNIKKKFSGLQLPHLRPLAADKSNAAAHAASRRLCKVFLVHISRFESVYNNTANLGWGIGKVALEFSKSVLGFDLARKNNDIKTIGIPISQLMLAVDEFINPVESKALAVEQIGPAAEQLQQQFSEFKRLISLSKDTAVKEAKESKHNHSVNDNEHHNVHHRQKQADAVSAEAALAVISKLNLNIRQPLLQPNLVAAAKDLQQLMYRYQCGCPAAGLAAGLAAFSDAPVADAKVLMPLSSASSSLSPPATSSSSSSVLISPGDLSHRHHQRRLPPFPPPHLRVVSPSSSVSLPASAQSVSSSPSSQLLTSSAILSPPISNTPAPISSPPSSPLSTSLPAVSTVPEQSGRLPSAPLAEVKSLPSAVPSQTPATTSSSFFSFFPSLFSLRPTKIERKAVVAPMPVLTEQEKQQYQGRVAALKARCETELGYCKNERNSNKQKREIENLTRRLSTQLGFFEFDEVTKSEIDREITALEAIAAGITQLAIGIAKDRLRLNYDDVGTITEQNRDISFWAKQVTGIGGIQIRHRNTVPDGVYQMFQLTKTGTRTYQTLEEFMVALKAKQTDIQAQQNTGRCSRWSNLFKIAAGIRTEPTNDLYTKDLYTLDLRPEAPVPVPQRQT